jgi:hypothetical protein
MTKNMTFNVDDFLTPTELTFQGSGTFKGIQGNRAVINTTESPVKCHVPVLPPIQTGQLSTKSQESMQTLHEIAAAAAGKRNSK